MSRRSQRVGDLLLETLSELVLREVKDPRVGAVTLTRADVGDDLRQARVYFCTLGDEEGRARAADGLNSASRFLQGKVARLLHLRYAPGITFVYDESFDAADRIDRLLRDLPETKPE